MNRSQFIRFYGLWSFVLFAVFGCQKLPCCESSSTHLLVHISSYFYFVSAHEQNSWVTCMQVVGFSKFYPTVFPSSCTRYIHIEGMNFVGKIQFITLWISCFFHFCFQIIIELKEVAKTCREVLCILHPASPIVNILHNLFFHKRYTKRGKMIWLRPHR